MTPCTKCGARTQLYLCPTCQRYLAEMLETLPWLLEQLEVTRLRQDRLTTGVVGKGANPSPINVGCMELSRTIDATLSQLLAVLQRRFVVFGHAPANIQMARWLGDYVEDIARHELAKTFFTEIASLVGDPDHPSTPGRILAAINRTTRIFAGPCPTITGHDRQGEAIECGLILYGDEGQTSVECPRCHQEIDVARNRLKASVDRDLLPENKLLEVLETLDEKVTRYQLLQWIKTGKLHPRGWIHQGQVVGRRVRRGDPRVFSLSQTRHLNWSESEAKVS